MGRYINVDLDTLRSAKSAIFDYITERNRLVSDLNVTLESTKNTWRGEDSDTFLLRWEGMNASDGILTITGENILSYKNILSAAYKAYKQAQSESVEQASKIGGWT